MQKLGSLFLVGLVLLPLSDRVEGQTQPPLEAEAMAILKQSADYLKRQPSYEFAAQIAFDDVMVPDFKVQYQARYKAWVQRPDHVRVDYDGDRRNVSFYYDGKMFTLLDQQAKVFSSLPAPASMDATLAQVQSKYDVVLPLDDFLSSDPYKSMSGKINTAYYLGKSSVAGVQTRHLVFRQADIDWQIWVEDGTQPLPRKLVITYKNLPGSPQYTAIFTAWQFKPIANSVFSFVPPAQASSIESIPMSTQSER